MQRLKIDVTKIDKALLFTGAKGTYMDLTLMDNRDGTDQYGNDGFIVQDVGKEKRETGIKGPIIGNWKYIGQRPGLGITSPEYGQPDAHNQAKANGYQPQRATDQNGAKPPVGAHSDHEDDDDIPF